MLALPGKSLMRSCLAFLLIAMTALTQADEVKLKPYVLAATIAGNDVNGAVQSTSKKLTDAGFQIVGQYSPYKDATILVITNDALRNNASKSPLGAFGAGIRVTVTHVENEIQIAFTNPVYLTNAYRMQNDMADVNAKLASTLGNKGDYGSDEGLAKEKLREYHYKFLMPYFDEPIELAQYKDYKTAVDKVEEILKTEAGGVKKVYRIDLPGKEESVFGVNMTGPNRGCSGDEYIMSRIDFKKIKSTGHLPYEVVVSKGKVYTLPAEFRIAIGFPDLSMMGSNSFASIMCAPASIKEALTKAVGGKLD